ncbi:MAG: lysophospholipid acyltransferase family protein [Candidatus Pelagibacter sp.]|nr:lysophospholipid acyltransferase family protein [Candidatus Pelagibacter sp.]
MIRYLTNKITKFDKIKKLYENNYNDLENSNNFWQKVLEYLNIKYFPRYLEKFPSKKPIIIVANHPFGLLDGLIISSIITNLRSDYKILINDEITQIDLIRDYLLPIKFSAAKKDIKKNIQTKRNAIKHVNNGGVLIAFPSGEVATSNYIFDKAVERNWKPLIGSIIKKTNCKIFPVYFHGNNSLFFQIIGFFSESLRRLLFVRELLNKRHNIFFLTIGKSIKSEKFNKWNNANIAEYLKKKVLNLN